MGNGGRPGRNVAVHPDCPDYTYVALWSREEKKIILIELAVRQEQGCELVFERKTPKYQDILHGCRGKGWQA